MTNLLDHASPCVKPAACAECSRTNMTRNEAITSLCKLMSDALERLQYEHPADCVCENPKSDSVRRMRENPLYEYQNDGAAIELLERAFVNAPHLETIVNALPKCWDHKTPASHATSPGGPAVYCYKCADAFSKDRTSPVAYAEPLIAYLKASAQ